MEMFNDYCQTLPAGRPRHLGQIRDLLIQKLELAHPGPPWKLKRADAERFYRLFLESNKKVAEKWFDGVLFDDDFSEYPETKISVMFDAEDIVKTFVDILTELTSQNVPLDKA